jgi:hypothetical protein
MGTRAWYVAFTHTPLLVLVLTQGMAGFLRKSNVRDIERVRAAIDDGVARLLGDCDLAIDAADELADRRR